MEANIRSETSFSRADNSEAKIRLASGKRRKLSIPAVFNSGSGKTEQVSARRRFSNVGDVVSRKFSTTLGWRNMMIGGNKPPEEVVTVGRALCILYVRTRLKRAGVFNKKLGLTRVRSAIGPLVGCSSSIRDVFPALACACSELERMYPRLYSNILRQTNPIPNSATVAGLTVAIGHHLLGFEPSWGKVVAMYSIVGGLAVDCIRRGNPDQLHTLLEDMTELLEDRMAIWVHSNGGWASLIAHCHQEDQAISVVEYLAIFAFVISILLIAYFLVRFFVKISVL